MDGNQLKFLVDSQIPGSTRKSEASASKCNEDSASKFPTLKVTKDDYNDPYSRKVRPVGEYPKIDIRQSPRSAEASKSEPFEKVDIMRPLSPSASNTKSKEFFDIRTRSTESSDFVGFITANKKKINLKKENVEYAEKLLDDENPDNRIYTQKNSQF